MTKTEKKILWGLLFFVLLISAFFVGAFIGFNNGYAYRIFHAATSDAYITLCTIEAINAHEQVTAQAQLEQELDAHIVKHWDGLVNRPYDFIFLPQNDEAMRIPMGKVAEYRKAHPSKTTDAKVKAAIDSVVNRYHK
jgi:hypothetical protein